MVTPVQASLTADNTAPGNDYVLLSPSDSVMIPTNLNAYPRSFLITATGDVVLKSGNGNTLTFPAVPAGYIIPCSAAYLMAATTATVYALY